jgi:hypothetical protein
LAIPRTDFGRLLETKTSLAVLVVALTGVHSMVGSRTHSRRAIAVSRMVSTLLFLVTLGIFWLAVRMTEG